MLDTSVKIFSSAQTGAPSLSNSAGNLIALLDACLVNGFGLSNCDSVVIAAGVGTASISTGHSAIQDGVVLFAGATGDYAALNGERKVTSVGTNTIVFDATGLLDGTATGTITVKVAAAGWLKPFSGTNLAVYKAGNVAASGAHLRVDDTTTTYASVRGYEAMTDVSNGTGQFPTTAQAATCVWQKSNATGNRTWWLIGNDRIFYLLIHSNASASSITSGYTFGDLVSRKAGDAYRAALYAASTTSATSDYNANPLCVGIASSGVRYMLRSYSALGSPAVITQSWFNSDANTSICSGYGGRTFPNPADNGVVFTPVIVTEGAAYRGELPGIFATPQNIGAGLANGTRLVNMPGYDRTLIYLTHQTSSAPSYGGVFFDLTGPWGS